MSSFSEWIGKPVILQIKMDGSRSILEGKIVNDSSQSLHFQAQSGRRTLIIPKICVLAVGEVFRKKKAEGSRQSRWEMPLAS